jgi:hypothetical protein
LLKITVRPSEEDTVPVTPVLRDVVGDAGGQLRHWRLNINFVADPDRLRQNQPVEAQLRLGRQRRCWPFGGQVFKNQTGIFAVRIPYSSGNPAQILCWAVDYSRQPRATAAPNIRWPHQGTGDHHHALCSSVILKYRPWPKPCLASDRYPGGDLFAPAGTPPRRYASSMPPSPRR